MRASPNSSVRNLPCAAHIVRICLVTVILKLKVLTETEEVSAVLSHKLHQLFDVPLISLSGTMLASSLGSLVLSLLVLITQVRTESDQIMRKARAARARRLRYCKDGTEVLLPPLQSLGTLVRMFLPNAEPSLVPCIGPFHLFLSHNWMHGQEAMRIIKTRLQEMLPDVEVFLGASERSQLCHGAAADTLL